MGRMFISVPDKIKAEIEEMASEEGRTISNLVAFVIEKHVREERAAKRGENTLARR